nr:hypothetical protein [Tanacetum cinerariifolium]
MLIVKKPLSLIHSSGSKHVLKHTNFFKNNSNVWSPISHRRCRKDHTSQGSCVTVKSLFAAVEYIMVSQTVDVKRIKEEVEVAAKEIKNGEKILVILDDVWGELKLDEVGIPCGAAYKNCKILLTSSSRDVCETMKATCLISVDSLQSKEAWILFKRAVGDAVETDENLKNIADKIVKGCGGLPLIIQVVEAKLCFLPCSMFPEDYNIPLERLTHYWVGLASFKYLDSMEDARNEVRHAVKILKSTCLLLDGNDELTEGSNKFLVKAGIHLTEWQPRTNSVKSENGISLMENRITELPDYELEIPLLGFVIQIGGDGQMYCSDRVVNKKTLILGMNDLDSPSVLQVEELIKLSDGIIFYWAVNLNNIVPTIYCESLDDLTTIMLYHCHSLLSLVDSSDWDADGENTKEQFFSKLEHLFLFGLSKLDDLWNCPDQYISLMNLVTLDISYCNKLARLFSVNVARGLVNLQTLKIEECDNLKEVIWDVDEGDIDMVVFRRLVKIELRYLINLKSFYAGKVKISYPSLEKVEISWCKIMEKWDNNGTYDTPNLKLVNQAGADFMGDVPALARIKHQNMLICYDDGGKFEEEGGQMWSARWWKVSIENFDCYDEWLEWIDSIRMSKKTKIMMKAVFYTSWWMIWWFRNSKIFKEKAPKKTCFFDELQSKSFMWCRFRGNKSFG